MRYTLHIALCVIAIVNLGPGLPCLARGLDILSETAERFGLTTEEVRAVFGADPMTSVTRALSQTECHSGIAHRIQLSCGSYGGQGVSGMTEQDKKSLAISLTLCSIQSALQSIPTECLPWSPHSEALGDRQPVRQGWFRQHTPREEPRQQALCLGAQDWSSYNVFLSDATQLCHVLESRKQAELAQMRYMNATQEKLAFIDLLKRREGQEAERNQREATLLQQRLADLKEVSKLVFASMSIVRLDIETSKKISEDVQTAFAAFEIARSTEWDRIDATIQERLRQLTDRFQGISEEFLDTWIPNMSERLENVFDSHELALLNRNEQTDIALQNWMRRLEDHVNTFAVSTGDHLYLTKLDDGFKRLESMMEVSLNATSRLSIAQIEIAEIVEHGARSTQTFTETQVRLEASLNRTIDALRSNGMRSLWSWIQPVSVMSGPTLFPSMLSGSHWGISIQLVFGVCQIIWHLASLIVCPIIFRNPLHTNPTALI
ncbi:hypothetical protein IAU59_005406 [Kwoniella sp. CBS 9459]